MDNGCVCAFVRRAQVQAESDSLGMSLHTGSGLLQGYNLFS
jgi:hypothetical protein